MKKSIVKTLVIFCLFFFSFTSKSYAQNDVVVSTTLTPSCGWTLAIYDTGGNYLTTLNGTTLSALCILATPGTFYLNAPGCATKIFTSGGTWTGPFTFPCLPSSFCIPANENFTITTSGGCSGAGDLFSFTF
jgi:hypothetical protein